MRTDYMSEGVKYKLNNQLKHDLLTGKYIVKICV